MTLSFEINIMCGEAGVRGSEDTSVSILVIVDTLLKVSCILLCDWA